MACSTYSETHQAGAVQFVVMAVFSVVLTQFTCVPGSNEDGHEEKGTEAPFPMCAALEMTTTVSVICVLLL